MLEWMSDNGHLADMFVAVLTSSEEPSDIKKSYALGAKTFLVKPPSAAMIQDIARAFNLNPIYLGRGIDRTSTFA